MNSRLQIPRAALEPENGNCPGIKSLRWFSLQSLFAGLLTTLMHAAPLAAAETAVLEFIAPTNNAVFSTRDEVPIVLRASASNDVFLMADLFANNYHIAALSYCCSLCPCARPIAGQQTTLQIPVP